MGDYIAGYFIVADSGSDSFDSSSEWSSSEEDWRPSSMPMA